MQKQITTINRGQNSRYMIMMSNSIKQSLFINQLIILCCYMIDQIHNPPQERPQLPYTPLQFIHTQTIGSKTKAKSLNSNYNNHYKDILVPHYINHHNCIFYILFHIPSVYNWLRDIPSKEATLLNEYLLSQNKVKQQGKAVVDQVNFKLLLSSLQDYVAKWQVVKLAFSCNVYVNRVKQNNDASCSHLAKTQVFTYSLNYDITKKYLTSQKVNCKQCKRQVDVECQIRQHSYYLLLHQFYGITLSVNTTDKPIAYDAILMMSSTSVYVKCANKVWYEIVLASKLAKPIGIGKINQKQIKLAVYAQFLSYEEAKVMAKPIVQPLKIGKQIKKQTKIQNMQQQIVPQKNVQNTQQNKVPIAKNKDNSKVKIFQLKYQPVKVLLKDSSGKAQNYIREVQKLYIKPKQKDEYELDYDRGKVKKIKEKKIYIKPDFNQIHAQLKQSQNAAVAPADQTEIDNIEVKKKKKKIRKELRKKKKVVDFGGDQEDE